MIEEARVKELEATISKMEIIAEESSVVEKEK